MLKLKNRGFLPFIKNIERQLLINITKFNKSFKLFEPKSIIKKSNSNIEIYTTNSEKEIQKFEKRGKNRENYNLKENQIISGFRVNKINSYNDFQIKGFQLEHEKTGAKYYHLDSEDLNNAFGIHFTTPAFDNTGVFHILEHLSLCGSKKYQIRDPFMNMLKRSLNTYMNAWTGNDFTMYPFATQNIKDFKNLFDVYLDAVYSPNLNYYDFLQEGWRYEFLDQSNKKSGLIIKGVVFNEMKGDMGRQDSYFIQKMQSHLFNKSTYNNNSGGDPRYIPELKYEDLVDTHKKYYHPSNTKFISYGDMNFIENLEYLNEAVLNKYQKNQEKIYVPHSVRFEKPKEIIDYYMPEFGEGEDDVSKFAISFLCQDINEDPYETFKMSILSQLLMEGPSSPMFRKLIESGLAPGFIHGCGYDTSIKEGTFTIGVQNIPTDYKHFKKIENAISEGLEEVAEKGFESKFIDEILHMVEFDSKRPRDDFGINLVNQSFGFITHSNYPFVLLHLNEFCDKLRKELETQPVFQILVKKYLLENNHKLKLILKPKLDLIQELNKEESEKLLKKEKLLSQQEIDKINKDTQDLIEHQNKIQDINVLPSLTLEDIPRFVEKIITEKEKIAFDIPLYFNDQPTNGISLIRLKANIKDLPNEFKELVNLYSEILPKLGTGESEYQDFQNRLHTQSSGLGIYLDAFTDINDNEISYENLILEFSFLDSNITQAMKLIEELLSSPNFYDFTNLNQIIKQESVKVANEINNNSLDYAIDYASAGLLELKSIFSTFKSDMKICNLGTEIMKTASPKDLLNDLAEKFYLMHNLILRKNNISFCINGNRKYLQSISASCSFIVNAIKNANPIFLKDLEEKNNNIFENKYFQTIIRTPAQVNDCVEVFKVPNYKHEDFAKCVIMGNLAALTFLHKEIREIGGAYGSGASLSDSGICSFYSFRDPNPQRTYLTFEKSIVRISEGIFMEQDIIDSKIYSFSILDKIINPGNKGLINFMREISEEDRNQFRKRLLNVTKDDIIEVSKKYFIPQIVENKTSRVIFGGVEFEEEKEKENWEILNSFDFLSESYFKAEEEVLEETLVKTN